MKKSMILGLMLAVSFVVPEYSHAQGACGLKPVELKPLNALGCKDLKQVCVCAQDSKALLIARGSGLVFRTSDLIQTDPPPTIGLMAKPLTLQPLRTARGSKPNQLYDFFQFFSDLGNAPIAPI